MAQKRFCAYCKTQFQLKPHGKHAIFCSDSCRKSKHKADKREQTHLVIQVGNATITIKGLPVEIDRDKLVKDIFAAIAEDNFINSIQENQYE